MSMQKQIDNQKHLALKPSSCVRTGERSWVRRVARTMVALLLLQNILPALPAQAQTVQTVTPNANAPAGQRPILDAARNGVPIVHIAPPSPAGVSRNQYENFNVNTNGLILNNSPSNVQTQLGGWITGNNQLGLTPARIILNEVVGANPSQLRGTMEVAGYRADIVVANPNGITCDGCGFLNTSRVSLSTGQIQFGSGGAIHGFDVRQGQLTVGGNGLDATNLEQLDLIARGIVIEGEVWAKNLKAIAGANQVLYGTLQATGQAGNGTAPAFAIDIKDLGGMYANQVYMVSTEQGLGVNSTGRIAALQSNLTLSANGDLTLKDSYAKQTVQLSSAGNTTLNGQTVSESDATIASTGKLIQRGTVEAQGTLTINAASLQNTGNIVQRSSDSAALSIAGSAVNSGTIFSAGSLQINASDITDNGGKLLAAGNLALQSQTIALNDTTVTSDSNVALTASLGKVAASNANVYAGETLTVAASNQIANVGGTWQAIDDVTLHGTDVDNRGGQILSNRKLTVTSAGGANDGLLDNRGGTLIGNAAVSINSGEILNAKGAIATSGSLRIDSNAKQLDNTDGSIVGNDALDVTVGKLINTKGGIASVNASINVNTNSQSLLNDEGRIQAFGNSAIQSGVMDNRAGTISGASLQLTTAEVDNSAGQIVAGGDFSATTKSIDNRRGLLQAAGNLAVNTQGATLDNRLTGTNGGIVSGGTITLTAGDVDNRSGYIASVLDQTLTLTGVLDNGIDVSTKGQPGGVIVTNGKSTTTASSVLNSKGVINALGDIAIRTSAAIDNRGGAIASNSAVKLITAALDNSEVGMAGGDISGRAVEVSVTSLGNVGGTIRSSAEMSLNASSLDNTRGVVSSAGNLSLNAPAFDNGGGKITGAKAVVIDTGSQTHSGYIASAENLTLNVTGDYSNSGTVLAEKELILNAVNVSNSGKISAVENLTVNTGNLSNVNEISATTTTLNATGTLTNTVSGLIDGTTTTINANTVANTGRIYGDLLKVQADTLNNSSTGVVAARSDLLIGARNVNNTNDGLLYSLGDIVMAGGFDGNYNAIGEVQQLVNGSAKIEAGQNITLSVKELINRNDGLVTSIVTTSTPVNQLLIQRYNSSDTTKYDATTLGWNTDRQLGRHGAYALPSTTYPFATFGSTPKASAFAYDIDGNRTGLSYALTDPIWALMGVSPPQTSDLSPNIFLPYASDCEMSGYALCRDYQTWQERMTTQGNLLDQKITAFNNNLYNRSFNDWYEYQITRRDTTETVLAATRPAQILAGGAISISSSGSVLNDNSSIVAGGAVGITGATVENRGTEGTKSVTEVGTQKLRYVATLGNGGDLHWYDLGAITGAPVVTTTTLQAFTYRPYASNPTTSISLATTKPSGVNLGASPSSVTSKVISTAGKSVDVPVSQAVQDQLAGQNMHRNWTVPNNSLFIVNAAPGAKYLVETDPRFTNRNNFLSSDYYLEALNRNPERLMKRYGDGFVEQQMVNDQILALTGRRYFSGYTSTESEYKSLMDAGIAYAKQYQISPGVALSAEQMALLTTDIVLLVTKKVTLADGSTQEVLVPQVYLRRPQAGDILPNGGLIAGSDVYIKSTGDLVNSGQISADNETTLLAGNDLVNRGGRISGQDVFARANNDLKNISGMIQGTGTNSRVALSAGRDVILETRTIAGQTAKTTTTAATSRGNADRIATVQGGTVTIDAARDLIGKASKVQAETDLAVVAGRDIKVSAVETSYALNEKTGSRVTKGRTGYIKEESVTNELAAFDAGNNIALVAGKNENGDVALKGVNINAGNNVAIEGANVTIEAVKDSRLVDIQSVSKNKYYRAMESDETIVGGAVSAGNNISVRAVGETESIAGGSGALKPVAGTGDVRLAGVALNATNGEVAVVANNNVIAEAMVAQDSTASEYYKKSKSLFRKTTVIDNRYTDSTEAKVTSLNSANGAVTVIAGNNLLLEGAQVNAAKDATLYAGNQLLAFATHDTYSETIDKQKWKSGVFTSFSLVPIRPETRGTGNGKTTFTYTAQGPNISSAEGNVTLYGAGAVGLEGAGLTTTRGNIGIAGGVVDIRAATDAASITTTHTEKGAKIDAFGWSDPSEGVGRKTKQTSSIQETTLARTTMEAENIRITATAGDVHIAGTTIATPGTLTLGAASGSVALDGQQTEITTSAESFKKDLVYQKAKGKGGTEQVTEYNNIDAGTVVVEAPGITAQVGSKDSVAQLAAQPGMGWVNQIVNDPKVNINWEQIEDISSKWDYKAQGLTPEGAAVLTVVVAYFTWGAASGAGAAVGDATVGTLGVTGSTIAAGATTAAVSTLATQAAIAVANNPTDPGAALKELGSSANVKGLIAAMVTGGALQWLNLPSTGEPALQGGAQKFTQQLSQNLQAGVAKAVINTAVYGGSLEDNLKSNLLTAFIDTGAAQGAHAIGDMALDNLTNKIAHAMAGCAAGAATAGSEGCSAGALGAAMGEIAAEGYGVREDTVQFAGMISGIAAAVAGLDAEQINVASQLGANAAANNYLKHAEARRRSKLMDARGTCKDATACETIQSQIDELNKLDAWRNEQLKLACANPSSTACQMWYADLKAASDSYKGQSDYGDTSVNAERTQVVNDEYRYRQMVDKPTLYGAGNGVMQSVAGVVVGLPVLGATIANAIMGDEQAQQALADALVVLTNIPAAVARKLEEADIADKNGNPALGAQIRASLIMDGAFGMVGGAQLTRAILNSGKLGTVGANGGVGALAGNGEGLFSNVPRVPYTPTNSTLGQAFDFSCAAASCRMAANLVDTPEAYVRQAILTDASGTALSNIPSGLQQLGFSGTAKYSTTVTTESITAATNRGASVIVNVTTETGGVHAIVVDSVKDGMAYIRDPWPLGTGSSYAVPINSLESVLTGKGVVVHP
ncbi:hypothetical protein GCM10027343_20650 [Noviherbaspirillum agri]